MRIEFDTKMDTAIAGEAIVFDVTLTPEGGDPVVVEVTAACECDYYGDIGNYGKLTNNVSYKSDFYLDRESGFLVLNESTTFRVTKATMDKQFPETFRSGQFVAGWDDHGTFGIRWEDDSPVFERGGKKYLVSEGSAYVAHNGREYYELTAAEILGEVQTYFSYQDAPHKYVEVMHTFADAGKRDAIKYALADAERLESWLANDWDYVYYEVTFTLDGVAYKGCSGTMESDFAHSEFGEQINVAIEAALEAAQN